MSILSHDFTLKGLGIPQCILCDVRGLFFSSKSNLRADPTSDLVFKVLFCQFLVDVLY